MQVIAAFIEMLPLLGKPVAEMLRKGAWAPLAMLLVLVWAFVLYPLLVPLLASWLLSQGILGRWHQPYAESVRRAFKVEELAENLSLQGNRRLDYFHSIDVRRRVDASQNFLFAVQRNQRMALRPIAVGLTSVDPYRCPVPLDLAKDGVELFDVRVGNTTIGSMRYGSSQPVLRFEAGVWARLRDEAIENSLTVSLDPKASLRQHGCDALEASVQFTVEVYKDLVSAPGDAASAAHP